MEKLKVSLSLGGSIRHTLRSSTLKINVGAESDVLKGSENVLTKNYRQFLTMTDHNYLKEALEVTEYLWTREVFTYGEYVYTFKPPDNIFVCYLSANKTR
ncbi:MAG: hypothetical protein QXI16_06830 [Sulfolobaceae archaeon]